MVLLVAYAFYYKNVFSIVHKHHGISKIKKDKILDFSMWIYRI